MANQSEQACKISKLWYIRMDVRPEIIRDSLTNRNQIFFAEAQKIWENTLANAGVSILYRYKLAGGTEQSMFLQVEESPTSEQLCWQIILRLQTARSGSWIKT